LALELASRAAVLDSGLWNAIKGSAEELVYTTGGQREQVPEFLSLMRNILDKQMNEFCRMDRFQVVFEDTDEEVENAD
jgi:phage baseplate assembly protein W